jgi:hypothetical protein
VDNQEEAERAVKAFYYINRDIAEWFDKNTDKFPDIKIPADMLIASAIGYTALRDPIIGQVSMISPWSRGILSGLFTSGITLGMMAGLCPDMINQLWKKYFIDGNFEEEEDTSLEPAPEAVPEGKNVMLSCKKGQTTKEDCKDCDLSKGCVLKLLRE